MNLCAFRAKSPRKDTILQCNVRSVGVYPVSLRGDMCYLHGPWSACKAQACTLSQQQHGMRQIHPLGCQLNNNRTSREIQTHTVHVLSALSLPIGLERHTFTVYPHINSYLLHQCLKRTNMIVLSFRSVAGEITDTNHSRPTTLFTYIRGMFYVSSNFLNISIMRLSLVRW